MSDLKEKKFRITIRLTGLIVLLTNFSVGFAQSTDASTAINGNSVAQDQIAENHQVPPTIKKHKITKHNVASKPQETAAQKQNEASIEASPVIERATTEEKILSNSFGIAFYKPTYVLPFYYTRMPDNAVYEGETPQGETLKKSEVKYQLSFKVPLWAHIYHLPMSLFFAYTQMSYWQLYDRDPFFRETDYEPEAFLAYELNWHLFGNWHLNFINVGAVHQSNGYGGALERSWNRIYISTIASSDNWVIGIRPWVVFHDDTYERQNPNMAKYMGHEQFTIAYKYYNQVFALEARNVVEDHARRSGLTASWSFPITKHLNGYFQVFSGYGQSLIEYDHRTNSAGIGIALSNWV